MLATFSLYLSLYEDPFKWRNAAAEAATASCNVVILNLTTVTLLAAAKLA